ncbi:MAG: hypothetical protein PHH73_00135 [Candidatus Rickettsiella isopodorum]|nr:hypothetical protein [Candidatus Rickettsiella isopodorum]
MITIEQVKIFLGKWIKKNPFGSILIKTKDGKVVYIKTEKSYEDDKDLVM